MSDQMNLYKYEEELYYKYLELVCSVDKVGICPLAGPLVEAACIIPLFLRIKSINDSKKLSLKKREELYKIIVKEDKAYNVVFINKKEIYELNIFQATKKGMLETIKGLKVEPNHVLIVTMPLKELELPHTSIIYGDALSSSIAAASIQAKVTRDHYMENMDVKYPNYGFKLHKGYCTKAQVEALEKYGLCKIHRKTFTSVSKYFTKQMSLDLFGDAD